LGEVITMKFPKELGSEEEELSLKRSLSGKNKSEKNRKNGGFRNGGESPGEKGGK